MAAVTRQLMLGEALPPLLLILTDAHGNRIEQLTAELGKVEVAVRPAEATSPGRSCHLDIQVTSDQVQLCLQAFSFSVPNEPIASGGI